MVYALPDGSNRRTDARETAPGPVSRLPGANPSRRDGVRELRGLRHRRSGRPAQPSPGARPRKGAEAVRAGVPSSDAAERPRPRRGPGKRRGRAPVYLHELRGLRGGRRLEVFSLLRGVRAGDGRDRSGRGRHPRHRPLPDLRCRQRLGRARVRNLRGASEGGARAAAVTGTRQGARCGTDGGPTGPGRRLPWTCRTDPSGSCAAPAAEACGGTSSTATEARGHTCSSAGRSGPCSASHQAGPRARPEAQTEAHDPTAAGSQTNAGNQARASNTRSGSRAGRHTEASGDSGPPDQTGPGHLGNPAHPPGRAVAPIGPPPLTGNCGRHRPGRRREPRGVRGHAAALRGGGHRGDTSCGGRDPRPTTLPGRHPRSAVARRSPAARGHRPPARRRLSRRRPRGHGDPRRTCGRFGLPSRLVVLAVAGAIPLAGLALAAASGPAAAGTLPWFIGIVSAVPWPAALTISEIRRRHATSILRRELVLAERDMARRNYERSLQEYDRAIAATRVGVPGAEIPWYGKGATLILLGRYEEALRAIDMALDINPRNEVAWVNKGNALTKMGRLVDALRCFNAAIKVHPNYEVAWNNKGNALARLGKYEEALQSYERALEIEASYRGAWVNKGFVLTKLGRFDEAASCADRALHLEAGRRAEPA